ncbi:ABC-type transport system substrate-binding protein [Ruminiclostridium sufflavum DSM 19573]|uniref:ABC-type transport system substrate-binding protein n=1 Tax=Ruminiclostridium sufflavum DSM 19573 TaxID=1121337 RepID=A0A318YCC7_9FIRM|nr:ABC transporter substrate-binding protein [Ruminiclostridium sufflavum]PYG90262.1 ABC-type transport system substrate-binding protein [Ruminiclostridium sufflavum DSM 19573]
MKKSIKSLLAMSMAVMIILAGCGQTQNTDTSGKSADGSTGGANAAVNLVNQTVNTKIGNDIESAKDTMVISIPTDPGSMDIHYATTYNYVNQYTIATLLKHQYRADGSVDYVCNDESLATAYKLDDNDMGVTFTLREGVTFQNGYALTAADVAFSIKRCKDLSYFNTVDFDNIKVVNDNTIYVPFKYVDANSIYNIGIDIPIYSEKYFYEIGADKDDSEFCSTAIIGAGPYKLVEWKANDYLLFEAYDNYFAGKPKIKNLRIRIIKDPSVAFMELQNGGVDIIAINPNWTDVEAVLKGNTSGIACWEESSAYTLELGFNCSGPLSDLKLRQAIACAVDKQALAEGGYQGSGVNTYSLVSLTLPGTTDYKDNWPYQYDPERAKQLLADAGYKSGELTLKIIVGAGDTLRTATAEAMGAYLKEIGINLKIVSVDIATYASTIAKQPDQWDMFLRNFGSGLSIAPSAHAFFKDNVTANCHIDKQDTSAKMLDLATKMGEEMNIEKRNTVYKELQDYYINDCLYTYPIVQAKSYMLVNQKLKNVTRVGYDTWSVAFGYFEK